MRTLLILVALAVVSRAQTSIDQAVVVQELTDQARLKKAQDEIDRLTALHEADAKKTADLTGKLAGWQSAQRSQKAIVADTNDAVHKGQEDATITASKEAAAIERLRLDVQNNQEIAKAAAKNAEAADSTARSALITAKSSGINIFLQGLFYIVATIVSACAIPMANRWIKQNKGASDAVLVKLGEVHESSQKAAAAGAETKEKMVQLEVNTNNKMDRLLETTSAAKYAEGRLKGAEDAKS